MSKVTMPEPVAWGIYNPTLRSYELSKAKVETKYRDDGTVVYGVVPFITTTQAEAYAAAKVREALEEAALQSQDREDAERYRWLRLQRTITDHACVTWNIGHDWVQMDGAELDAAIDHARRVEVEVRNEHSRITRGLQ